MDSARNLATKTTLTGALMDYRQQLAAFVRARCRDGNVEIEDVMHELWLRCCGVDAASISDPKSYLYRMAHNLILDRSRRALMGQQYEDDWNYSVAGAGGGSEPPLAERRLLAREHLAHVDGALRSVGERAAWVFRRYRIDGVQQTTIADELGVSLSTVEKDLRKAYDAVLTVRELSDG